MEETCCVSSNQVMLLSCSGGSNVGQLSNQAVVELTKEGFGKMYCLAGIGGKLSGFVASAKSAPLVVLIDGCEIGCGKKIFENEGIPLQNYIVITQLGITKNKEFDLKREDIEKVKDGVKDILKGKVVQSTQQSPSSQSCCC